MRKKKLFRILEERLKHNYIVIELFKRQKIFSFGVSTSIGNGDIGHPEQGAYRSYFEAKNATPPRIPPTQAGSCVTIALAFILPMVK